MNKTFLLLIYISISYLTSAQCVKLGKMDVVLWSNDYDLRLSDFGSEGYKGSRHSSGAQSTIFTSKGGESCILILGYPQMIDSKISMNIINVFVKNYSWINGELSNPLLEHEQVHFDISEYYTRLIRYYLSNITFNTEIEAQAFIDACMQMYSNDQRFFDIETNYGSNLKEQSEWKEKINAKIISLDKYYKSSFTADELSRFEKQLKAKYK